MADQVTSALLDSQAEGLERDFAGDVWRSAAAQHLRAAANFLRNAERQEEAERQAAEATAAAQGAE